MPYAHYRGWILKYLIHGESKLGVEMNLVNKVLELKLGTRCFNRLKCNARSNSTYLKVAKDVMLLRDHNLYMMKKCNHYVNSHAT